MSDDEGGEGLKPEAEADTIGEYQGDRNDAKQRHGYGRTILPNGDFYQGQYRKDMRHGLGIYVFMKNGARYTGQYFNGLRQGIGTFYYPDGTIYEGEWKAGLKHGYGMYMYANGDAYEGQWYKDVREGIGLYRYVSVPMSVLGTWRANMLQGPAQIITKQYRYHGAFKDNLPLGEGCYTFKNETMQHGFFVQRERPPDEEERVLRKVKNKRLGAVEEDVERPVKYAVWNPREVTKFVASRLPVEPRPFEYPESEGETGSDHTEEHEPPTQAEVFSDLARFDKMYLDEKKLTEARSWSTEVFDCDLELRKLQEQECPPTQDGEEEPVAQLEGAEEVAEGVVEQDDTVPTQDQT